MQERQQFAKNRVFWPTSPAFDISVGMEKPEWLGYPMVKKKFKYIFIRFGTIH